MMRSRLALPELLLELRLDVRKALRNVAMIPVVGKTRSVPAEMPDALPIPGVSLDVFEPQICPVTVLIFDSPFELTAALSR
jgi:hypothetical protein